MAAEGAKSDCPENFIPGRLLQLVLDAERFMSERQVQLEFERELMAREGSFSEGDKPRGGFSWKSVDGTHTRYAEIYPNAHNDGQTFDLILKQSRNYEHDRENWRGADWDLADAKKAGWEWANRGIIWPHPIEMVKEIMES